MATLFTSALLLAVVFSSSVFVLIRCALRTINIPAKICFIYDRTHFFFSAIILGMAFNVLPSDVLVLVWEWMVDKNKGWCINKCRKFVVLCVQQCISICSCSFSEECAAISFLVLLEASVLSELDL